MMGYVQATEPNPLRLLLTAGQHYDCTQAAALPAGFEADYVIADKGYDIEAVRFLIINQLINWLLVIWVSCLYPPLSFAYAKISTQPS